MDIGDDGMLAMIKKNFWSAVCVLWAMALALFWFAMRVIWSGISKVVSEAVGENVPSTAMLNLPLYISILLWAIFVFAVVALIWLGHKKWSKIMLTVLLIPVCSLLTACTTTSAKTVFVQTRLLIPESSTMKQLTATPML
jgi:hypothetical protein